MTDIIFSSIIADLKAAIKHHKHPFRYVTLATCDSDGNPRQRTVVLRDVTEHLDLIVYTDRRSCKITDIQENPNASFLFYDPNRLLQVTITTKAEIISEESTLKKIWDQIPGKNRKDYTTEQSPGKEIKNPDDTDYLEHTHFFTAIRFIPKKIEYLRLKRPNHIRALFTLENSSWKGSFIVP